MEAAFSPAMALTSPIHSTKFTKLIIMTTPTCLQLRTKNHVLLLAKSSSAKPNANQENAANEQDLILNAPTSSRYGCVFDLGQKESWDSIEIGSPVVKRYLSDQEERWYMWYHGKSRDDKERIGLAVSSNGIHWEKGKNVMKCNDDWWAFDTQSIRPCEVVIMSSDKLRAVGSVYWLYYTGFSSEKIESRCLQVGSNTMVIRKDEISFKSLPGLAISQDGRYWARLEGEHHSGALFDVGLKGEWDSLFIASPKVVFHSNGDLRMYYHSYDVGKGEFAIGIARSKDGMKWIKLGKVVIGGGGETIGSFDELGVLNPHVVRNKKDGKYLMVYEGVDASGSRSIGMAMSSDGLKGWKRLQENPVLVKSEEGRWDSEGVGSPYIVQMDGDEDHEWRLYYRGIGRDGRAGIGMAVSQGNEVQAFQKWTGFHV